MALSLSRCPATACLAHRVAAVAAPTITLGVRSKSWTMKTSQGVPLNCRTRCIQEVLDEGDQDAVDEQVP